MPYWIFAPSTALAALLWALLYFFAGSLLASQWQSLVALVAGDADDIAEVAVVVILLAIVIGALVRRRRGRQRPVSTKISPERDDQVVPAGPSTDKLPLGLHCVARFGQDELLLNAGNDLLAVFDYGDSTKPPRKSVLRAFFLLGHSPTVADLRHRNWWSPRTEHLQLNQVRPEETH